MGGPELGNDLQEIHGLLPVLGVSFRNQIFNATIIDGTITVAGQVIASCEMRIFIEG